MGFVRLPAFYTMEFHGELAGLVIQVRGMNGHSWGAYAETGATEERPLSAAGVFMERVDGWNLKHADGCAVAPTLEEFLGYDHEFMRGVLAAWIRDVLPAPYPAGGAGTVAVAGDPRGDLEPAVPHPVPEVGGVAQWDASLGAPPPPADDDDRALAALVPFIRDAA